MRLDRKTRRTVSVLLTVFILFAILSETCLAVEDPLALFRDSAVGIGLRNADPDFFPGYAHYDPEGFYSNLETFAALAAGNDPEQAFALYDSLYAEVVRAHDLYYAADIGCCEDVKNTRLQDEKAYINKVRIEMKDRFLSVMREICTGANADAFREHIGSDAVFDGFASYAPLTEKAKALLEREEALCREYDVLNDAVYAEAEDPDDFDYASANARLGEIFLELVSVRKQIAAEKGCADYTEYADKELYFRDYSEQDLAPLKEAVKKFGADIYYYTYYVFYDSAMAEADTETILGDVGDTVSEFSEKAADAYRLLREKNLLSAGFEESRAETEVTQSFPSKGSAVIAVKFYEGSEFYNYKTFAHELGHFAHMSTLPNPNPLFMEEGCSDVMELHSTFLETLFANQSGKIYKYPDFFQGYELCALAYSLLSGCFYDDWQREIYKNEGDLTLDEINALFKEICLEYGVPEYETMEYEWIWVSHNFKYPLYYIGYATSGFAALQLWNEAETDFAHAVDIWEKSLSESPYAEGYLQAMENIGFDCFTRQGNADETIGKVILDLKKLEENVNALIENQNQ